jgi:hypothetical protein
LDEWGVCKVFSFYDKELKITYNGKTIFKRNKPKSFKISSTFFNELWDCDIECYGKKCQPFGKGCRACCIFINCNIVITGGNFTTNKRPEIQYNYDIIVNGNTFQMDELAVKTPPCPYHVNKLCTVGFPHNKIDFYTFSPFICATTPGMFIRNKNDNLSLMRKFCTCKSERISYTLERWNLDKLVLKRFYTFYEEHGLTTDFTFLHLLENRDSSLVDSEK